ncbi:protein piccolo-like isoform X1 [Melanaphis sacchari]|uniref:protein piccolo-like isoform X1 n=1 Tax=Melanaphis sacchari TaxID=742174 RepID=UPI000DC15982|nr:protein piccolo-like isoform X1 [Melanaphis sacchari]XP_025196844.1 protein piccolo-like isoform X1 [Melanaphis sacchari]
MASSPLRAPAAAGQPQSRLMDMQKKFQEKHLANLASIKGNVTGPTKLSTTSPTKTTGSGDLPVPPVRRIVGAIPAVQPQQRRPAGSGDSVVQVDVKGKLQRPAARINSKTATVTKKPLATVNGNVGGGAGGVGRVANKKPMAPSNDSNRLLLPPVVQPTVINAIAAGAGAAAALASVSAATAAGAQKPLVRAAKLPQKPAAPRRVAPLPAKTSPRPPPVVKRATPAAASPRPQPAKQQLSADRGPPAKGMARCPLCARDFAEDRLPKHEQVCRRTRDRDRKRKVFDTSKKRLEAVAAEAGVDVSSFKKKSQKEDQRVAEKLQKKKDAWRRKHDQLVRNVRAARAVQRHLAAGGSVKDLPPELENATADQDDEVDSDLVKCPHCGRTFNEASAERHIPLCADRQRNAAARMQNKKR